MPDSLNRIKKHQVVCIVTKELRHYGQEVSYSIKLVLLLFFALFFSDAVTAGITHAIFIVNRTSNGGTAGKVWDDEIAPLVNKRLTVPDSASQVAAQKIPTYEVAFTTGGDSGTKISSDAYSQWLKRKPGKDDQLLIVAAGGDGTVSDVVQPFVDNERVVFGIFPIGTANELARSLGVFGLVWQQTLDVLLHGDSRRVGAYKVDARLRQDPSIKHTVYAIDEVDIGFLTKASEVKRAHDTGERPSRLLQYTPRSFIYTVAALSYAFEWFSPGLALTFDGQREASDIGLFLAYTGSSSGGFCQLFPAMTPDKAQGQSLISTSKKGWKVFFQLSSHLMTGYSNLLWNEFNSVRIDHSEKAAPEVVQVDGELRLQTPADIKWVKEIFTFKVPWKKLTAATNSDQAPLPGQHE